MILQILFALTALFVVVPLAQSTDAESSIELFSERDFDELEALYEVFEKAAIQVHSKVKRDFEDLADSVEEGLTQLDKDLRTLGRDFYDEFLCMQRSFHKTLRETTQRYKKHFARTIFSQKVGWQRLRHSTRDSAGLCLGIWLAFRGYSNLDLRRGGSQAFEVAILAWDFFMQSSNLPHSPWLLDAVAGAIGLSLWKINHYIEGKLQSVVSLIFVGYAAFHSAGIVLFEWDELLNPQVWSWFATLLSFGVLKVFKVPPELAASSASGALLAYLSVRSDFASNWFWILETLGGLVYTFGPILRDISQRSVKTALRVWRLRLRWKKIRVLSKSLRRGVERAKEIITFVFTPFTTIQRRIAESTLIHRVQLFCNRLQKAVRPILWPWAVSLWGVGVQLGHIHNIGSAWKYFRLTWDPVSFIVRQVVNLVSIKAYSRRVLLSLLRGRFHRLSSKTSTIRNKKR